MNNLELLSKAAIVSGSFTGGIGLSSEDANTFIDYMVDESELMKNARIERMAAATKKIFKLGIGAEVLVPATAVEDPGETVGINTAQIILSSKEMIAIARINDDSLEDNIEGEAFVDHLMRMIASAGANQLEYAYLMGKIEDPAVSVNDLFNGWYERIKADSGNAIDTSGDADRFIERAKFSRLLKTLPSKYKGVNRKNLRFIVASDIEQDYADTMAARESALGDAAAMGSIDLAYRKIPIVPVALLPTNLPESETPVENDATFILLTDYNNLIIGIQRDIRIETQREARLRATDFVMTLRVDIQLENPEAAAVYDLLKVR